MINRSVAIVTPQQPFVAWLRSLPEPTDLPLAEINDDNTVYLLPECDSESRMTVLRDFFDVIFEDQLTGWWQDPEDWPEPRTFELFLAWFDVDIRTCALDLLEEPITEEWDE